ncbi:MAG: hypothetical protein K8I00_00055 [Candidatus Omnitrophica bacterium]|nr:hypothetical protein [Candidatus Omnitrophota bacterium]
MKKFLGFMIFAFILMFSGSASALDATVDSVTATNAQMISLNIDFTNNGDDIAAVSGTLSWNSDTLENVSVSPGSAFPAPWAIVSNINLTARTAQFVLYTSGSSDMSLTNGGGVTLNSSIRATAAPGNTTLSLNQLNFETATGAMIPVNGTPTGTITVVPPSAATISLPANGATLNGCPVTIQWSQPVGALQYWLNIGTTAGGSNIYSASQGTNQSATLNLPLNGQPLYATLYTQFNNGWPYTQTTWNTADLVPQIITPSGGSELTTVPTVVNWTIPTGNCAVEAHWITVKNNTTGVTFISKSIAAGVLQNSLPIPLTGDSYTVTLMTKIGGRWFSRTAIYTTQDERPMFIQPSDPITSNPVTFEWTAAPGASEYWFTLGTAAGATNLKNVSTGTGTTITFDINLTGNPVYASVSYKVGNAWFPGESKSFGTINNPNMPGMIILPPPGSQITSDPTTFEWTPGVGAIQHWLTLGTTPGGTEYLTASQGLNTQKTVDLVLNGSPIYAEIWTQLPTGCCSR